MANVNLGEALISLIGGFAPGYAQGRRYRAEKKVEAEERERQRATEERVFEQRQNKINEQIAGREEMFGLLEAAGGISPRTPADEVLKIKAQYLDAADRAGHDLKTAQAIFDDAIKSRKPQIPSEADLLDLEAKRALIEQRRASARASKERAKGYRQRAKQLKDADLVASINALRLQRAQYLDKFGDIVPGKEAEYDEINAQLEAFNEENATRKRVIIKKPEVKERIKVDY